MRSPTIVLTCLCMWLSSTVASAQDPASAGDSSADSAAPAPSDSSGDDDESAAEAPPGGESTGDEPTGDEPDTSDDAEAATEAVSAPTVIDVTTAEQAPPLTDDQHEFLEPSRKQLPQNPYAQASYNAYALEWGEFRVGITDIAVGVAPRVELGTNPVLDGLRVPNVHLKGNALRAGPVDAALLGRYRGYNSDNFTSSWMQMGAMTSIRATDPWTIHLGGTWDRITGVGLPNPSGVVSLLDTGSEEGELEQWFSTAKEHGAELRLAATAVSLKFATDIRFNRRDSIVFQASGIPWFNASYSVRKVPQEAYDELKEAPPVLALDELLAKNTGVGANLAATYSLGLSYQANFKRWSSRIGMGWSAVPGAFLMETIELNYHFGGKTRNEERRMRSTWRRNKSDVVK